MKRDLFIAAFGSEDDILGAVRAARQKGYDLHDVYTPYPVHGLEDAMGLKSSRLTYVCFGFAFFGLLAAVLIQFWIGSIDWPLNVGGRPFNSLPAYLPVTFELTVLFGGLGVLLVMFFSTRLFPGKKAQLMHERINDDYFVMVLDAGSPVFDLGAVHDFLSNYNVLETENREAVI